MEDTIQAVVIYIICMYIPIETWQSSLYQSSPRVKKEEGLLCCTECYTALRKPPLHDERYLGRYATRFQCSSLHLNPLNITFRPTKTSVHVSEIHQELGIVLLSYHDCE